MSPTCAGEPIAYPMSPQGSDDFAVKVDTVKIEPEQMVEFPGSCTRTSEWHR